MSESFIDLKCNKSCRHIRELEQQLSELKESQKQKQIIKLCNRLDKAEQQNEQMLEALIELVKICNENNLMILSDVKIKTSFAIDDYIHYGENISRNKYVELIESVTNKKIEEVIK